MGGAFSTQAAPVAANTTKKTGIIADVVVIPVDASKNAEKAFEWYATHAYKPSDVVHIVNSPEVPLITPLSPRGSITDNFKEQAEVAKKSSQALLAKYEQRMKELNIQGSVHSEMGHAGEVVVSAVDRLKATHIVMGTRGYGLIRRTVLGSISQYVVHHTSIPVTVVPAHTAHWFF